MRVVHVCSELYPLLKTGGLADVTSSLSKAQMADGEDVRILMPGFSQVKTGLTDLTMVAEVDTFAGHIVLRYGYYEETGVYIVDAPHLYDRPDNPYHDSYNNSYIDNYLRFAILGWFGAELVYGMDPFWKPDILHAHDWHGGLACAYLAAKSGRHLTKSVFTIHNLAYQGCFEAHHLNELWLPHEFYSIYGIEYYGQISYLKSGIYFSGRVTTVSPTYAKEIITAPNGFGLEGLLADRMNQGRLTGILNGLDDQIWDPRTDTLIAQNYNKRNLNSKTVNKEQLQKALGLEICPTKPLFAIISRLVYQKGLDLVLDSLDYLLSQGGQFVLLGCGDRHLEWQFSEFLNSHPHYKSQMVLNYGYNDKLAHQTMAAADILIVPSRFEPCGLTQMAALRYGTVPLVHYTGGLADTVVNSTIENIQQKIATGFVFYDMTREGLRGTLDWVFTTWKNRKIWRSLQQNGMSQNWNWQKSAQQYLELYHSLL